MATALGIEEDGKVIPFDFTSSKFINAYFAVIHKPYEREGVNFWWIDWQQGIQSKTAGLDPLWALNHYHTLDHEQNHSKALILSRYAEVGSHRYPVGFSGDTWTTWDTLDYLPYFTATATNIGYTWWSNDIGGHGGGEKNDELYLRHLQFGVFSPINRLHCTNQETFTKEPWYYGAAGTDVKESYLGAVMPENRVIIDDGVAKLPDKSSFAGSIGTMDRAVRFAVQKAGLTVWQASQLASLTPARLMGISTKKGSLEIGKDADMVCMNSELQVVSVYVRGKKTVGK